MKGLAIAFKDREPDGGAFELTHYPAPWINREAMGLRTGADEAARE